MKILYVASEVAPYIKTGGLADVAGALPQVLAKKGQDTRVVLPLYGKMAGKYRMEMEYVTSFKVNVAWRRQYCGIFRLENQGVTYYFIDNEHYFKREGVYGYGDDCERYAFFSRAVLEMLRYVDFCPDVINANDWQSALVPTYLKLYYGHLDFYRNIKTVMTIHNIGYQGQFGRDVLEDVIGINNFFFDNGYMELDGDVNLLKAGIVSADAVTTVSNTYAQEIKSAFYGHGLQSILRENEGKLYGILNGLDIDLYNPETNPGLFRRYNADTLDVKQENKKALLQYLGMEPADDVPVIGIISRFVSHKGFDLVEAVLDDILSEDVRVIVLGTGDFTYEQMFHYAKRRYPGKISVNITFSEDLANKIYSGVDLFLMPSVSEPCGLAQMIAMRYGTLPIVRETGGLADTVQPYVAGEDTGCGFTFANINAHDMLYVIREACGVYRNDKKAWQGLMTRAMEKDVSWDKSAGAYLDIYQTICE